MERGEITVVGVGDIFVDRAEPESMFALSGDLLRQADIAFGQSETAYSDKGSPAFDVYAQVYGHGVRNYVVLPYAGFDVISMASNHTPDWGQDSLLDCMDRLRRDGIAAIGAGRNIDEAREPVILERNATRVAFLARCSVAPRPYYATSDKFGVAPMRANTRYEPYEDFQPGTPPQIITTPIPEDLDALIEDVKQVRPKADVVVVSLHWGLHHQRATIAQYQPTVAHAVLDAGADLILGHHPHILKGIEVYKGKVIFYSLGNWAIDSTRPIRPPKDATTPVAKHVSLRQAYHIPSPDPEYPTYRFPPESRKTIVAKCIIANGGIQRVSFIPALVNKQGQPEPLSPSDPRGEDVVQYMREITQEANLNATYTVEGGEVVVR
ncbi:MAG: CapA family protein [Chloroflexi bacterium]|nr:CapA family protein [Chloroflexota bacterium]